MSGRAAEAKQVFDALAALGVDLADVFRALEEEVIEKFDASWAELLSTVKSELESA